MKGLFLKDLYMTKKYWRGGFVIVLLFLVVGAVQTDSWSFYAFPSILASLLPVTLLSYDEKEHWIQYSSLLPCSRERQVTEKYLFVIFAEVIVWILTMISILVGNKDAGLNVGLEKVASILPVCVLCGLLAFSLTMPFIYWLGVEKGRIVYFICIIFAFLIASLLGSVDAMPDFAKTNHVGMSKLLMYVCGVVVFLISWKVSALVYKKREV